MNATIELNAEALKEAFAEVAPLYTARPALHDWLDKHGFAVLRSQFYGWCVIETDEGRGGMNWGEPFLDYAACITAILDEIVKRAKES